MQESSSLCRVFSPDGQSLSRENQNLTVAYGVVGNQMVDTGSVVSEAKGSNGQEIQKKKETTERKKKEIQGVRGANKKH